jgi:hypothetical protein
LKKTYTIVHVDTGQGVEAWFPDFPGLTVSGDRLADTLFTAPLVLQRFVWQLRRDRVAMPEPTTPNLWAIHNRHSKALVGFANVETNQISEEITEDEALDEEISRDAQRSGYREEDAVEIVRQHRREKIAVETPPAEALWEREGNALCLGLRERLGLESVR